MRESDTFHAQAARCRQEAIDATLANVRDRALRAEVAWTAMAERSVRSETARDAREARPLADVAPGLVAAQPEMGRRGVDGKGLDAGSKPERSPVFCHDRHVSCG